MGMRYSVSVCAVLHDRLVGYWNENEHTHTQYATFLEYLNSFVQYLPHELRKETLRFWKTHQASTALNRFFVSVAQMFYELQNNFFFVLSSVTYKQDWDIFKIFVTFQIIIGHFYLRWPTHTTTFQSFNYMFKILLCCSFPQNTEWNWACSFSPNQPISQRTAKDIPTAA